MRIEPCTTCTSALSMASASTASFTRHDARGVGRRLATTGRPRAGGSRSPRTAASTTAPRTPPGGGAAKRPSMPGGNACRKRVEVRGEHVEVEGRSPSSAAVCASMRGCTSAAMRVEPLLAVRVPVDVGRARSRRRRSSESPGSICTASVPSHRVARFANVGDHLARRDQVPVDLPALGVQERDHAAERAPRTWPARSSLTTRSSRRGRSRG